MDLISIIVPVYKTAPWLDRCLRSIAEQRYRNLEILLVDDGSPDNCGVLCDTWARRDSRIKVIHQKNGGLSAARNAGLAAATGEYIAFVDSDDWIHPLFLSALYDSIRKQDAQIAACDFLMTEDDVEISSLMDVQSTCHSPEEALDDLTANRSFRSVVWNKLYHRDMLLGEQFPNGRCREDEFFTYRVLHKAQNLAYVDAPLYFYFQRPDSIMHSASLKHLDVLDAWRQRLDFFQEHYPRLYFREKAAFCTACANLYLEDSRVPPESLKTYRSRIKAARASVRFSPPELFRYSFRQLLYIIGSRHMGLFCPVLRLRRNRL